MIKWVVIAVFGVGLILVALCGAGLYLTNRSSQAYQRPVFETIVAEDADAFLELCDPSLQAEVDAPVMLAWMKEINAVMGECKYETGSNFNIHFDASPGSTVVTTTGDMKFANGVTSTELVYQNDKLIKFKIEPDKPGYDWFDGPVGDELYRERTEIFFTELLERDYEALKPLMHSSFVEIATDELLNQIVDQTEIWLGDNPRVTIMGVENRISEDEGLIVNALLEGNAGKADGSTTIKFDGMKGTVLRFVVTPIDQSPIDETTDEDVTDKESSIETVKEPKSNVDNNLKNVK
ncbi:hypothetical protein FHS27_002708 [Rhodopirellula rubra]|uniref:Uncharacterized protein n=1 Tax=Aporhodopirellula rubra TaxID=980271 RepID=A0A7W5DYK5_9BACT|nr:hypothetical protein [Aporhodopirellula rubra]MBB3206894.1 hypothetical protein [Aporhodopirellula rubra]